MLSDLLCVCSPLLLFVAVIGVGAGVGVPMSLFVGVVIRFVVGCFVLCVSISLFVFVVAVYGGLLMLLFVLFVVV